MKRDESGKERYNFGTFRIHARECAEELEKTLKEGKRGKKNGFTWAYKIEGINKKEKDYV